MSTQTSSTPSSSGSTVASSLITIQTFTGQSTYSADFQNILNKAVTAQEIPLSGSVDQVNSDTARQSALQTIDTDVTSLQSAVSYLSAAIGSQSISASVSDPTVASATINGATPGTYQLEVDSLGSSTQTLSTGTPTTVTDPSTQNVGSSSTFTLTVNGTNYTLGVGVSPPAINMTGNTMNDMVAAINADSANLGVTASAVNVGSSGSPDYRLAVQTTKLGPATLQLSDGVHNLLTAPPVQPGSLATYKVDGLSTPISNNSDSITLAPGLTVNLLSTTPANSPVTITVAQSASSAESALQNLATAYNQVMSDLNTQHGENAGALSGESILLLAHQALSSVTTYSEAIDGVTYGLTSLGMSLSNSGALSFDATQFNQGLGSNLATLSAFLGDTTQGFIANATNSLNTLEDPTTGSIKTEESSITKNLTTLNTKISEEEADINSFQNTLVLQLAHSDAAISTLQSQNTFFQQLFQTMNANNNG